MVHVIDTASLKILANVVVANRPRESRPRLALKFSYGFGGHNACLVVEPATA